jgi:glycosyltransferase involved in cell wall biosynthesis
LSYYFFPHVGGGTWATYNLSKALAEKGHKIRLIVPNVSFSLSVSASVAKSMERNNLSEVHRVSRFPIPRVVGPFLAIIPMFLAGLKNGKEADIIVSQFHPHHLLTPAAVFLGRIFKIPIVVRACDVYRDMGVKNLSLAVRISKIVNLVNEFFIRYVNVFLVPDPHWKKVLLSRMKGSRLNCDIGVSNNGFDSDLFHDLPSKKEARDFLGIGSNAKVVLFIGRFSGAEYGIDILLKAFSIVFQEESNALLILVGDNLPSHLQALINSLGISKKVRVYRPMPKADVIKFIVVADVCVGPLMATQTIPLKILEYMACGKPIVTGRNSISVDLSPELNFLVVDPYPNAVSEALLRVLKDSDYAGSLGSNALKIVDRFSWERIAADLDRVLSDTVKKHHNTRSFEQW